MPFVTHAFKGLVTNAGLYSKPPGASTTATNFNVSAAGRMGTRRGFAAKPNAFGGPAYRLINNRVLGDNFLVNFGSSSSASGLRIGNGSVASSLVNRVDSSVTPFPNTPSARMHDAVVLKNQYLTTSDGPVRVQSDVASSLVAYFAGMPRPPGIDVGNSAVVDAAGFGYAAAANWLPNGNSVAYREVWVAYDTEGTELVSAPSGRFVFTNGAGANRAVALRSMLPKFTRTTTNITTSWKLRIYRSPDVTGTPIDEMQLAYEVSPTAGDITAGYIDTVDVAPFGALGAYLYTNTISGGDVGTISVRADSRLGDGILASNDYPPVAKDVATFRDCLFYANLSTTCRGTFSIIAVGTAGNVLKAGDILNINGAVQIKAVGVPVATNEFAVVTAGAAATNIRDTAINMVSAINRHPASAALVVATYLGNDNSPGTIGKIMLEAKDGRTAFTYFVQAGSSAPYLGLTLSAASESWTNGLAFSKPLQADAVPPANYLRVSRNDTQILRIAQLGDSLYVFTDAGIWRVRGRTPSDFYLEEFDKTFRLLAPESLVECQNSLYAWGVEGIARIDEGGVEYIDVPIRDTVKSIVYTATNTTMATACVGVAYRQGRRVVWFYPTASNNTACDVALVWHLETGAWTTYSLAATGQVFSAAAVRQTDDLLALCTWNDLGGDSYVWLEKSNPLDQYSDDDEGGAKFNIDIIDQWAVQQEELGVMCEWQMLQVSMDEYSGSDIAIVFRTEEAVDTVTVTSATVSGNASAGYSFEVMVPTSTGMGSRMSVAVNGQQLAVITGLRLLYEPVDDRSVNAT